MTGILTGVSTIIDLAEDRDAAKQQALDTLTSGSVVVLPVDGVYAIVADAFRTAATQRIFAARRRSRVTPLPVLLRADRQIGALARDLSPAAERLIEAFWPGALTLIVPATQDLSWDLGNGKGTVQLRQPADEFVRELIAEVGPLACTAANRLDQPRPTTVEAAKSMLGVLVPVYIDGGELDGVVSTIVDTTAEEVVVHREGRISTDHVMIVASGQLPLGERPAPDAVWVPPVTEDAPVEAAPTDPPTDPAAEQDAVTEEEAVLVPVTEEEVLVTEEASGVENAEEVVAEVSELLDEVDEFIAELDHPQQDPSGS